MLSHQVLEGGEVPLEMGQVLHVVGGIVLLFLSRAGILLSNGAVFPFTEGSSSFFGG
jgi:hypothetical protein